MKRLIYSLLCFMIATSQVVRHTSSTGATTNTQTNTSGSNTTISGGYSQESTTTYQSGSSSNTTSTTNNNSNTSDTRVANSAHAINVAMSQAFACGISVYLQLCRYFLKHISQTRIVKELN